LLLLQLGSRVRVHLEELLLVFSIESMEAALLLLAVRDAVLVLLEV